MKPVKPPPPAPAPVVVKSEEPELPIVETIGLAPQGRGWVVVIVTVQGNKVLSTDTPNKEPEPWHHAVARFRIEVTTRFARPQGVNA